MRRLTFFIAVSLLPAACSHRDGGNFAELDRRLAAMTSSEQRAVSPSTTRVNPATGAQPVAQHSDGGEAPDLTGAAFALSDGADVDAGETTETSSRRSPPMSSFGETLKRDLREMPRDLWEDTKAVYGSAPNLVILGLTYGGSLALQETGPDDTVEDSYRRHSILSESSRDTFNVLGNPVLHFALAGSWYLLGQQTQNDKTYEVGKTLFSALIINGVSTMVGQTASWDDAPNGEWGSFPSGHTSSAFTVASVMHDAYGPLVGVPLYGLGVLVGMSRLEDGEHYLSDVVMGGVMGLVIGHAVAGEHDFELFGGKILPFMDPNTGSSGLAWVKELKYPER